MSLFFLLSLQLSRKYQGNNHKKWYSQTTYTLLSKVNTWMKESYNKKTLTTHYKLFIATNVYRILDFKKELLENKHLFGNSSQPKRIKNNKIRTLTFFFPKKLSCYYIKSKKYYIYHKSNIDSMFASYLHHIYSLELLTKP